MNQINILFCGDKNVCDGIRLSALSLCKHAKEPMHIYILTASVDNHEAIPQEFGMHLQKKIKEKNEAHKVMLLNISDVFASYLPLANMGTRFTPLCMLRLFADRIPEIPDRILYLDTDVLCRKDFSDMYRADINDAEMAGVPDRYGKWFLGNVFKHDYMNSGVLLFNIKRIRESGLFEKCRKMCRDKKMFMPDQTALNKLAIKRKLDGKYNEQGKIKKDTVFKHFTTYFEFFPYIHTVTIKPWDTERLHDELSIYEFDDIIEESDDMVENFEKNHEVE